MRKALDNPYNAPAIEYRLSIPPSKVMEIIAHHTEKLSPLQRYIPVSTKENTLFWSRFESDDIFRIYQKSSAKGYNNSFAPWLVGWVKPSKEGSVIKLFFDMDERVLRLRKYSFYLLIFFTILIGWMLVRSTTSNTLTNENIIGVAFITVFWIFWYGLKKVGFNLGQRDKAVLLEFYEGLFAAYYV